MDKHNDQSFLLGSQYKDACALNARIQLHRFSVNKQGLLNWIFDHFDLPQECKILELGCGTGSLWKSNSHRISKGWAVTLTDFSKGILEQAKVNLANVPHHFEYDVVDAQDIPYANAEFDAVIADHMLYHVPDRVKALSEIKRVLEPGGKLYASTIGFGHMRELQAICDQVDPHIDLVLDGVQTEFGLENGVQQLREFFDNVGLFMYDDYLLVPEAKPVVDYIFSTSDSTPLMNEYGRDVFLNIVEQEISRNGSLKITKNSGMFVAS
ncbi:MAG: class I SAM-dependent methyltransferase [Armatimonadota bacterium]